jgi:hypothetical protein
MPQMLLCSSELVGVEGSSLPNRTFTLQTDVSSEAFDIGSPPPFPQAGSKPLPVANVFSGSYSQRDRTVELRVVPILGESSEHLPT